jgi:hypothetical protein
MKSLETDIITKFAVDKTIDQATKCLLFLPKIYIFHEGQAWCSW